MRFYFWLIGVLAVLAVAVALFAPQPAASQELPPAFKLHRPEVLTGTAAAQFNHYFTQVTGEPLTANLDKIVIVYIPPSSYPPRQPVFAVLWVKTVGGFDWMPVKPGVLLEVFNRAKSERGA